MMRAAALRRVNSRGTRSFAGSSKRGGGRKGKKLSAAAPALAVEGPLPDLSHLTLPETHLPPLGPSPAIRELAGRASTPLSLATMAATARSGNALAAAAFLHTELPVRLAKQASDIRRAIGEAEGVAAFYEAEALATVAGEAPVDAASEERFAQRLDGLLRETRRAVPLALAQAVRARRAARFSEFLASAEPESDYRPPEEETREQLQLDADLGRFFTARVGIRLLVEHYLALRAGGGRGVIDPRCRPADIAAEAAEDVVNLATRTYGASPAVDVRGATDAGLTYVPSHMRYAVRELLKNSVRAVVERHGPGGRLPRVRVVVAEGAADVSLKVEDEGGGCPRSTRHSMWNWYWSSGPALGRGAGGVGLPMTRCLARYFGGDLKLRPLEAHGTDAYLYLSKLGDAGENVPDAVRDSPGGRASDLQAQYFD
mmetsp:Transcript_14090/g.41993  ORF Transcript_14090/g.41993 Transcript_14090/m.41993 type:complete len:429 (+) Transcript_14090:210-1496(+)